MSSRLGVRAVVVFGLLAALAVTLAAPAGALATHPYFLRSTPAPNSVLTASPPEIDIYYTEGLDRPYSHVQLVGPSGQSVGTHVVKADDNNELAVAPSKKLTAGTWAVRWTAVGDDGHTVTGDFPISIQSTSHNPVVQAGAESGSGNAAGRGSLEQLARTVLPFAAVVLAGLLFLPALLAATIAASEDAAERVRRRATRLRIGALAASAALLGIVIGSDIADRGLHAFNHSVDGHRFLIEALLVAAAALVLRAETRGGEERQRARRIVGWLIGAGILLVTVAASHASTQPTSRRSLVFVIYTVHLVAVAVWSGTLAAAVTGFRRTAEGYVSAALAWRPLRSLVPASVAAVIVTGVADTAWGLRALGQVGDSLYGRLALVKLGLVAVMVVLGFVAARRRARASAPNGQRLYAVEAGVGAVVLIVAGVLGQTTQPIDVPYASEVFARTTPPVSVQVSGEHIVVGTLTPGLPGPNRLTVQVNTADSADFQHPDISIDANDLTVTVSGAGAVTHEVRLHRSSADAAYVGDVNVAAPSIVTVGSSITTDDPDPITSSLTFQVVKASLPGEAVVGVPIDLSGPDAPRCLDGYLGMTTALTDVNAKAYDHGRPVRAIPIDVHGDASAAMTHLHSLHAVAVALPCGTPDEVESVTAAAHTAGLPVVATDPGLQTAAGRWSLVAPPAVEGKLIADQARAQGGSSVKVIVGPDAIDQTELSGVDAELTQLGIAHTVQEAPSEAGAAAAAAPLANANLVVLLGSPDAILPLVKALGDAEQRTYSQPARGILASSRLMDTGFINAAGYLTRVGAIEFASDIDPFDPLAQFYAARLRTLVTGVRPSFDGLRGYNAGWVLAQGLRIAGRPSAGRLTDVFGTHFHAFSAGSFRGSWSTNGGSANQLAFFRSTYIDPMVMPSEAPGGDPSLAHEGTFLDTGGFVQVTPFGKL